MGKVASRVIKGIITVVIGGGVYGISQTNLVNHFASDANMTQNEAQNYINNIQKSDLESFSKVGDQMLDDGNEYLNSANSIDCNNYTYKWQSDSLSCLEGKNELTTVGDDEITLGNSYKKLDSKSATNYDISTTIAEIDAVDSSYSSGVFTQMGVDMSKYIKMNKYNKAVLESALDSKRN